MRRQLMAVALIGALLTATAAAQEEIGSKVYREVQGCVVALENIEGSGTGIILDATGLILTNAHVIASPLPFECKVDLGRGKASRTVTFKKVKIIGVHPTQDLALVRIDPREHKGALQVARLARRKAVPGQWVCAIGNPSGGGGVQLNKTITTGEISGVDRVIDKVAYYQISAPINAGNSGGPLCNRSSEVIGLVTLKFTDVENVGFALPLHAFTPSQFIPLSRRKGDPERVKELVEKANEMFDRSKAFRKRRGEDDEEAKFYRLMAAKLYHMALADDPGNDGLYYNVGMLLRGLDLNEVAAAYLLQAIELNPWGGTDADYFRELGFALAKQKKFDEAKIAWEEGLAKYPVKGAKIWEDLSIFYHNDQKDFHEAAYAAAVVLHLKDSQSRLAMAKKLFGETRDSLKELDRKKLDSEVADIDKELRRRKVVAEKARRTKKPYLTKEFAKYVENSGTLGSQDAATAVVRIDRSRPGTTGRPATPERPKLDLTIPAGSIDLLGKIAPASDSIKGKWNFTGGVLVSPMTSYARLQLPTKVPAEYDLTLIVERRANRKEFVIGFVREGVPGAFFLDLNGQASGVDPSGRGGFRGGVLTNNLPATVQLKIRREGLLVTVDGKRIFFQRTAGSFPAVPEQWQVPDARKLFVGSHISRYHVHKMMLTPYKRRK